jgi:hypothetical protein
VTPPLGEHRRDILARHLLAFEMASRIQRPEQDGVARLDHEHGR